MKIKQILVGGILSGTGILVVSIIFSWLTQNIWQYDVMELAGMRSIEDPICILYFVYPWVLGFSLSFVYPYFEKGLEGTSITKGWKFGLLMWIIVGITSAFLVFSSMDYPIGFTVNSVVGSLLDTLIAGIIIVKTFHCIK
ncbi:MAG: hypothetical protein BV459_03480 [Thermoplasmata archaeon M11B2D]|nr:MAG: hypothetical protein BV459_03480 [Thermoplasmata archaeon M11B2D]